MAPANTKVTLYTIPVSHYCEVARWALHASKTPFTEKTALPGLHALLLPGNPTGEGRAKYSVPYVRIDGPDGTRWLSNSWDILEFCGLGDSPDPEIKKLLNEVVSVAVRPIVYEHLLESKQVGDIVAQASLVQRVLFFFMGKKVWGVMRKTVVKSDEYVAKNKERLEEARVTLEEHLGLNRPEEEWDLSLSQVGVATCALLFPIAVPAEQLYGGPFKMPPNEENPPGLAKIVNTFRATPLGRYVLKYYAANRIPK
mmetsp:Transcript_16813/g.42684  ORF Transcript_16813/g.42684 Transcript_16813/m.42684 type:complete len:255 (+) Transcript_16813:28-792(+)